MKVYYGSDGLPSSLFSLPHLDYKHHNVTAPIPDEHWAYLFANRTLILVAAANGFGRENAKKIQDAELFNEAVPPALTALRDWKPDGGASKSTQVYTYVRNHFAQLTRTLYQCPGVVHDRMSARRKMPPRQLAISDLEEVVDEYKASTDQDAGAKALESMRNVDDRRKNVLGCYLGMLEDSASIPKLSIRYGVSRERIAQLIETALGKIRKLYGYGGSRNIRPLRSRLWKPRRTDDERREYRRKYRTRKLAAAQKLKEEQCPQ